MVPSGREGGEQADPLRERLASQGALGAAEEIDLEGPHASRHVGAGDHHLRPTREEGSGQRGAACIGHPAQRPALELQQVGVELAARRPGTPRATVGQHHQRLGGALDGCSEQAGNQLPGVEGLVRRRRGEEVRTIELGLRARHPCPDDDAVLHVDVGLQSVFDHAAHLGSDLARVGGLGRLGQRDQPCLKLLRERDTIAGDVLLHAEVRAQRTMALRVEELQLAAREVQVERRKLQRRLVGTVHGRDVPLRDVPVPVLVDDLRQGGPGAVQAHGGEGHPSSAIRRLEDLHLQGPPRAKGVPRGPSCGLPAQALVGALCRGFEGGRRGLGDPGVRSGLRLLLSTGDEDEGGGQENDQGQTQVHGESLLLGAGDGALPYRARRAVVHRRRRGDHSRVPFTGQVRRIRWPPTPARREVQARVPQIRAGSSPVGGPSAPARGVDSRPVFPRPSQILRAREGSLAEVPLPLLLNALHVEGRSCVLELRVRQLEKRIRFEDGIPVGCRSNLLHETLGKFLVEKGLLSERDYQQALGESVQTGRQMGELLIQKQLITPFDLFRQLQANLAVKILDCFRWTDARYRLVAEDDRDGGVDIRVNVGQLLLTGIGTLMPFDAVATHFTFTDEQRFAATPEHSPYAQSLKLSARDARLLQALDGQPDFATVMARAGLETEAALRRLYAFAVLGLLHLAEEVPQLGPPPQAGNAGKKRSTGSGRRSRARRAPASSIRIPRPPTP